MSEQYKVAYYKSLQNFSQRSQTELTVLLYHGVSKSNPKGIENYNHKHISEKVFIEHLRFLKKNCNVISLDEVVDIHHNKKSYPKNSVAITFDDGFANNHEVAAPALIDFNLPATFYVSSGVINTNLMFWVDVLEDCINRTQAREITVSLEKKQHKFDLSNHSNRLIALDSIKAVCKRSPVEGKNTIIDEVQKKCRVIAEIGDTDNYQKMNWKQVCELDSNSLFIVGGHSLYHDILGLQNPQRSSLDISASIDLLTYHLGRKQTHYSYPEGQANHYNDTHIALLKQKGIICSPSAIMGLNTPKEDLFHLRRVMVGFYGLPLPHIDPLLVD